MKKLIAVVLSMVFLLSPLGAFAQRGGVGFDGGIRRNERDGEDTKQYKEVVYVSGEAVVMEGTLQTRKDRRSIRYRVELEAQAGGEDEEEMTLSRNIRVSRDLRPSADGTQVVEVNNLSSYDETITMGDREYELMEYQFYNSTVDDNQPVVTHYQGSWNAKKRYSVDDGQAELLVEMTGNTNGFDQFWGGVEHQSIKSEYKYSSLDPESEEDWWGTVETRVLANKTVRDTYIPHVNTTSSFDGIYTLSEVEDMVMKYQYNMPIDVGLPNYRNIGDGEISFRTTPTQEQLYIPRYIDIKSHWGEMYIKKLAGLQAADLSKEYFLPDENISREEFAVWVAKALRLENIEATSTRGQVNNSLPRFEDIGLRHPNYNYIQNIKNRRIMTGVGGNRFEANGYLTRQEAATIMARALGIERIAPNMPFQTHYRDDREIDSWAKKAVYSVSQVGIMQGFNSNFSPRATLSKAEAAALIERLIDYIRFDLKNEYGI